MQKKEREREREREVKWKSASGKTRERERKISDKQNGVNVRDDKLTRAMRLSEIGSEGRSKVAEIVDGERRM
jgi:hypothetical protein